ncbi:hypothetical protein BCR37DRAFT_387874 [Protomyces lactucae-debilis]|uniref:Uncharacterized protein n=1 Tax=Protomyces lactucae-debilis TaxID=2754530 RepID=A0A1Y2FAC2_PROLT|nr:uncharacterized protein BCR37DRAFT_387874 [Protomyces lactucae-debilis]ORY80823.1 hypothetical protein BCR37DRAFT_387874 [Protomyces lactucae-debilis]
MRAPSAISYVWLFVTTLYLVLFLHNVTAAAGRTAGSSSSPAAAASSRKRAKPGSSIKPPPAGETANPSPGQVKPAKSAYHQKSFPVCRNVSVGYYGLFGKEPGPDQGAPGTSLAQFPNLPSTLVPASEGSCEIKCQEKIHQFEFALGNAIVRTLPICWASRRFSIVQRRARSMVCGAPVSLGCRLSSSLCECTFNLIIPEQLNETKLEMRHHRKKYFNGVGQTTSLCDMQRFPATMSDELDKKILVRESAVYKNSKSAEEEGKRSWPLFEWHSMPNEAVILGNSFTCPKPPAKIRPGREKPAGQWKKVITEVCLCPNNRDNGEGECSHKELICETISLTQAIDNLRRGGGGLFDVYMQKFPQLKDYVAPISGTAIATDQVPQQDWATLLTAVDSVRRKGLNIDLNVPAADEGDEL